MTGKVKITIDPAGLGTVLIDDRDLSRALRGFTIRCEAGERPTLDLDFCISEIEVSAMGEAENTVLVNIPDEVISVLLLIGWTPPENDPRTYRVARPEWEAIDTPALNERPAVEPYRDSRCTCPEHHDPFLMDRHHPECFYEAHSPDAND